MTPEQKKPARQAQDQTPAPVQKLTDDPRAKLALEKKNPEFGQLPGARSTGPNHKPVHASGKQGKREKKTRW